MDFFQTREKYRKREMRYSVSFLFRVTVIALVAWLGWLWGSAEQKRLQADSNVAIFESDREIQLLNTKVEKLQIELNEARAQNTAESLTDKNSGKFANFWQKSTKISAIKCLTKILRLENGPGSFLPAVFLVFGVRFQHGAKECTV